VIAAIYARRSHLQDDVATDQKSVTRQIEKAKQFALSKGWTTRDAYIFIDDGISGAEFLKRPSLRRLLQMLKPKAPFQVLIVSEQKSIGRESVETGYVIKQLAKAGCEVVEYVHGQSLTPRNPVAKLLSSVQGFSDEDHQVKTRERTHEAHDHKFQSGHAVGGRVFAYRNQDVISGTDAHGRPIRSHVERVIEPAEAAVVLRIFQLYDSGEGLKKIAKILTAEGALAPKPFIRRDPTKVQPLRGWAPSTIRAILTRELYHGVSIWNKSRKRDDWGQKHQQPRPQSEWKSIPLEHLRIIPEDLWQRVQQRRQETEGRAARFASGRLSGRPPKQPTQNLLAGLATCAHCGGGLVVATSARKHGRVPEYVCHRHRVNGSCPNAFRISVAELNEAILQTVEEHALTPEAIEQVIRLSERDEVAERQTLLEQER
jgi:site-specific DNA recombinase